MGHYCVDSIEGAFQFWSPRITLGKKQDEVTTWIDIFKAVNLT